MCEDRCDEKKSGAEEARGTHDGMFNVSPTGKEAAIKGPRGNEYEKLEMVCQNPECEGYSIVNHANSRIDWVLDFPILVVTCNYCGCKHVVALEKIQDDTEAKNAGAEMDRQVEAFYDDGMQGFTPDQGELPIMTECRVYNPDKYLEE